MIAQCMGVVHNQYDMNDENIKGWLFGFFVGGVFVAKTAKFAHFKSVWVVFFVFETVVIALFAFATR